MELGGNIELMGLSTLDGAELIVIKKIVGQFVKSINISYDNFEKFILSQSLSSTGVLIEGKIKLGDKVFEASSSSDNLFIALSNTLKQLENKLN